MAIKINNSKKSTTLNNLSRRTAGKAGVKYIVVHYTGNGKASDKTAAKNNCIYFNGGNRNASADFFVNDYGIWRYNPNCQKYYSWHCGDGHGKYGITNSNSIGIEVVSSGATFTDKEVKYLAWLVRKLMGIYSVEADHVVRHYDASRKSCPAPYCGSTAKDKRWKTLHKKITA